MKLTLRTRLTIWYMLAFLLLIFVLVVVFAIIFRQQLNHDLKKALKTEEKWLAAIFEDEFADLLHAQGEAYESLVDELLEELEERYGMKHQFAILAIRTRKGRTLLSAGVKNIHLLFPRELLAQSISGKDILIGKRRYRLRVSKKRWGMLAIGIENQTFFRVFEEFGEIFIWLIPVSLLLIAGGGWLLAKLAMLPVADAARQAETISMHNLRARLPAYHGHDEFGLLIETMNRMIARLEEEVQRLRQFSQDAAHELRTPLTVLRGELELAYQEMPLPGEARDVLQKTLDWVIHLSEIVENLLLLMQADRGAKVLQPAPFALDELVREVYEDCQILAEGRPVEVKLSRCDAVRFQGDRHLLRRLLFNLCDNALKYTRNGHVALELRKNAECVEIVISDTGEGIPAVDLPHVFDRFYRAEKARTGSGGGSGLGLSICKWIAEAHDGQIRISSNIGQGTSVHVTLPLPDSS